MIKINRKILAREKRLINKLINKQSSKQNKVIINTSLNLLVKYYLAQLLTKNNPPMQSVQN